MHIPGEEKLFSKLPIDMRAWYHFGKILKFEMEEVYDEEECEHIYVGKLIVTDAASTYKVLISMKGIYGILNINLGVLVSGLEINNLISRGFEKSCSYLISDFEQSSDLKIYCMELNVALIET